MPVGILTEAQRIDWDRFPPEIDDAALAAYFTFDPAEIEQLASHRDIHGRVAIAAAIGSLRWLGIVPLLLSELPAPAAGLIAGQLDLDMGALDPVRLDYHRVVRARLVARAALITGFRACTSEDLEQLAAFLSERALVHDGPLMLLGQAVDRLRRGGLLRPGITVLERVVANARGEAEREIARRVEPVLDPALRSALDELVVVPSGQNVAPVKELGQETRSVARVGEPIAKLELLPA